MELETLNKVVSGVGRWSGRAAQLGHAGTNVGILRQSSANHAESALKETTPEGRTAMAVKGNAPKATDAEAGRRDLRRYDCPPHPPDEHFGCARRARRGRLEQLDGRPRSPPDPAAYYEQGRVAVRARRRSDGDVGPPAALVWRANNANGLRKFARRVWTARKVVDASAPRQIHSPRETQWH